MIFFTKCKLQKNEILARPATKTQNRSIETHPKTITRKVQTHWYSLPFLRTYSSKVVLQIILNHLANRLLLQVKFLQNHVSGNGYSDLEKKGIMQLNSVFGNQLEKIRKFGEFDPKCQGMERELPEFLVRAIRKIESLKPWSAGLYRVRLENSVFGTQKQVFHYMFHCLTGSWRSPQNISH